MVVSALRVSQAPGAFGQLVEARQGHFRLESGHHSDWWLDLEALFADWRMVEPFVAELSRALGSTEIAAVCTEPATDCLEPWLTEWPASGV
jgi:hypothetical protein